MHGTYLQLRIAYRETKLRAGQRRVPGCNKVWQPILERINIAYALTSIQPCPPSRPLTSVEIMLLIFPVIVLSLLLMLAEFP